MIKKMVCGLLSMMIAVTVCEAQFSESFSDGDFTNNPMWVGGTSDWMVNAAFQLQSNNSTANSTFYLSTASTLATTAQWEFFARLEFNPSSANYADIYLIASVSDLTLSSTTGYFVRIGNTDDEISLYRKDPTGLPVKIIDGANGILNTSNNVMKIKITRNALNQWPLFRDLSGTGNAYTNEGAVTDATYNTSSFFGILVKQSTASFFQKHYFDDIEVKVYVPDITPPVLTSATVLSINMVDVFFNEPLDIISSQVAGNYVANNGLGSPITSIRDPSNNSLVHLTFSNNIPNGNSVLTVNGVADLSGNAISNGTALFSFYTSQQYDVVIDEIMADPTPVVGLPNVEWIELKNTSPFNIDITGWRLAKANSQSGLFPNYILKPDSFVVVCTGSAVTAMSAFGQTISVTSFPALDNASDLIYLLSKENKVVHSVKYTDSWYQNELKKAGGWTLEMIDTKNPCSGYSNWKASTDANGGTPGKKNSINANNVDVAAPVLLRAFASDSLHITLVFDEPLDSLKAVIVNNYMVSDGIGVPQSAIVVAPTFDRVNLRLAIPILRNKVYTVAASAITDCAGNVIGSKNNAKFGLADVPDSLDVVINEILFNPRPGGVDYVEIYNRSQKILNAKQLYIANRSSTDTISSITQISADSLLLFPGDFLLITENPQIVKQQYLTLNPDAFLALSPLPSFNNDKGDVIILDMQGKIMDEVKYSDKWHFQLIANTEGVSLERIDYDGSSTSENFHSAATSVGYGTPGYKNSQFRPDVQVPGSITVLPAIFSPDNDGVDDFANIEYSFPSPGYVANITIYDANGRPARYLERNALCGIKGIYRWDGLGDKMQKLPVGIYIIVTEVFDINGKTRQFKNTIVLARRFG